MKLKIMPKITNVHFYPNNFEKMTVNCAFQIFSLDVMKELSFYNDAVTSFSDPIRTIEFVKKMI